MKEHKHYVPVLKAKEGELKALQETVDGTKDHMTPLLEVTAIQWDYEEGAESKTIDQHLSKLPTKVENAWGTDRRIFVDSDLLESDRKMADGTHHLTHLFNELRRLNIKAVPVTALSKHADYKRAVQNIIATDKRGMCLRLQNGDFSEPDLANLILNEIAFYKLTPKEVDLVIDLKSIDGNSLQFVLYTVSNIINNVLPNIGDWRTLTVTASSFPTDLSDITASTIDTIDRVEWLFWNQLIAMKLKRIPAYGDYTISHWEAADLNPREITVSASIRYTSDTYWLILRGRSIKRHGSGQYHALCAALITRPEYSGAAFSWGDNHINECANGRTGPGNPTTWRKVGNNHHFQMVVTQVSSLP